MAGTNFRVNEGRAYIDVAGVEQYFKTGEIFNSTTDMTMYNHPGGGSPKFSTTTAGTTGPGHGPKTTHKEA